MLAFTVSAFAASLSLVCCVVVEAAGGVGLGGGIDARFGAGFDGLRGASNDFDVGFVTVVDGNEKLMLKLNISWQKI